MNQKEMQDALAAMQAKLDAATAALEAAKVANQRTLSLKVSEKGAVSIYGFGRFPVTMYATNLARLFNLRAEVEAFVEANKANLIWTKGKLPGEDKPASFKLS
jgi:nucleoid DNA-binding protein